MKRFLLSFIALLSIVISAQADSFEVGGIWYNVRTEPSNEGPGEVYVTKNESGDYSGDIVIPPTVTDTKTYKVTGIESQAFKDCAKLTSVIIPDGVTNIESEAFLDCTKLTSVTIPNSVTTIGSYAFQNCSKLDNVTLSNQLTSIGGCAFIGCTSLSSITFPNSLTTIDGNAFAECTSLSSITVPNSVTRIGEQAFRGCSKLTSVTLNDQLKKIEWGTFQDCTALLSITIPNSVTKIENSAFSNCTSLTSINIPDDVTKIESGAFSGCTSLTSVNIPDGVTKIESNTFSNCSSLTSIVIPNSITVIGEWAFSSCGLTSITIPNSVEKIGNYAFDNCPSLRLIKSEIESPFEVVNVNWPNEATLVVPTGKRADYKSTNGWKDFAVFLEEGEKIYDSEKIDAQGIKYSLKQADDNSVYYSVTGYTDALKTEIVISDVLAGCPVKTIKEWAFNGTSLTSIIIPNSITSIGSGAFNNCSALKLITSEITEPYDVDAFDWMAYQNATLVVPNGKINAYKEKNGWNNFDVIQEEGESVYPKEKTDEQGVIYKLRQTAEGSVYYSVTGSTEALKTEIVIPASLSDCPVKTIEGSAFSGRSSLTSVTIPGSVSINGNPFNDCKSLNNVIVVITDYAEFCNNHILGGFDNPMGYYDNDQQTWIYNNITVILKDKEGKEITDYVIPEGVTAIGGNAFKGCTNLSSITIPGSVTSIGQNAFNYCASLTSITIPDGVTSIGDNAFYECNSVKLVTSKIAEPFEMSWSVFGGYKYNATLVVPKGKVADYQQKEGWNGFAFTVEEGQPVYDVPREKTDAQGIKYMLRQGNDYSIYYVVTGHTDALKTEIEIPADLGGCPVRVIEGSAFYGCSNLTSVKLGNQLTTIGWDAFNNCSSLTSVIIPNGVSTIEGNAFYNCTSLASVTLPGSVTLNGNPFSGCKSLNDMTVVVTDYADFCNNHVLGSLENPIGYWNNGNYEPIKYTLYLLDNEGNEITDYVVPEGVTTIGDGAFKGYESLYSITIPQSVTSIGVNAFRDCNNLASVKIGKNTSNISSIGDYAFYNCLSLNSITLPKKLENIGAYAFSGDDYWIWSDGVKYLPFTSVVIPSSVKTIGNGAFRGCRELALVNFEVPEDGNANLTSIGDEAFHCCILTSITLPNSVTTIGKSAFSYNEKLTTANLGETLTEIKGEAFSNCYNLASVTIPDGVTSIGVNAFQNCNKLTSVRIPNSLTAMGENAFGGCPLKSIELPDAFTTISANLFKNNDFEYIKLGNNVKSIEKNAFGCRLDNEETQVVIEIGTSTPPTLAKDAFPGLEYLTVINVIVPDEKAATAYSKAAYWKEMTYATMDSNVEVTVDQPGNLGKELYDDCKMMPAKVVGLTIKGTINADDFSQLRTNFKSILRLDLSECDITEIPEGALYGKTQLQELTLPTKLQIIGNKAFMDCPYLTGKLELPSGVTSIGNSAFEGTNYTSVTLPSKLKTIGNKAFYNLPIKQKLTPLDALTSIGDEAFAETQVSGYFEIPDGISYIGNGAFRNTQIESTALPDNPNGITSISWGLFQGCSNFKPYPLYIPRTYTRIEAYAFDGCISLETVRMSPNLESIGEYAFQNTHLEYLKVPSKVDNLPAGVFKNCNELVSLSLPANLKKMGSEALKGCTALRNMSVEAITPPTVERSSFIGVNTDLCIISIPTESFYDYMMSDYWGQFVNPQRIDFDVETEGNGRIAFSCVEAETDTDKAMTRGLSVAATRSDSGISAEEAETESMTFTYNGSSVYVPKQGKVRFCIFPTAGDELLSVTLGGVDIMPFLEEINGKYYYTATADKEDAKLVVKFSGAGQAEQSTVTAKSYKRVYGDPNPAFSFDVDGAELDGNPVVTCEATATSPVGTYPIVITKGTETNSVVTYVDGTLTITKAPLTIKAGTYYKKPGEENPAFTLTYDGFKNNETSAVLTKQPTVTCSATKDSPVGDYEVTVSGAEAQNYEISYVSGKLTVGTTDPSTNPDGDTEMITIGKSGKASYCGDKSLDFSFSEEVKAYIATGFDESEGTIWLTRVKDVPAGTPVMIKGVAEKTYNVPVTNSQNSYYKNMFKGNTSGDKIQIGETENGLVNYYLSGDGTFKKVKGYANIGNNKSYLQLPGTFNPTVVGGNQTVTIKSSGKASYAAPVDLDFTNVEGLKAFTATGLDKSNSTIWLTRVMKVQKGEGLLLKGAAGDYQIPSVAVQSSYQNMFVGNTSGNSIQVKETSDDGSLTNFYLKGDGTFVSVYGYVNIGNNKSYLALPTFMLTASTRGAEPRYILEEPEVIKVPISFMSIDNDGDDTTGIRETMQSGEDGAYYTLQGQRVEKPSKGIYIRNGKKVIIR